MYGRLGPQIAGERPGKRRREERRVGGRLDVACVFACESDVRRPVTFPALSSSISECPRPLVSASSFAPSSLRAHAYISRNAALLVLRPSSHRSRSSARYERSTPGHTPSLSALLLFKLREQHSHPLRLCQRSQEKASSQAQAHRRLHGQRRHPAHSRRPEEEKGKSRLLPLPKGPPYLR